MSKIKKMWMGILAFSPLVVNIIFMISIFLIYFKIIFTTLDNSISYSDGSEFIYMLIFIIIFAFLMQFILWAVLIIFTICIIKNRKIEDTTKILYLIGIYFLSTIVPIIYFFIEILNKNNEIEENKKHIDWE